MKTWKISAALLCAPAFALAQEEPPFPGESCSSHADCGSFEACIDETCTAVSPSDMPCESDFDCDGGACLDGTCWMPDGGTGIDPTGECTDDADCPDGALCEEGFCIGDIDPGDLPGSCQQDADCAEGEMCMACYCMAMEGTCRQDADCPAGQRCDIVSVGSAGGSPDGGGEPMTCEGSYGFCAIDISQIEPNPACVPFCEAAIACGGSDEPVSSEGEGESSEGGAAGGTDSSEAGLSADTDECVGYCSYLLQDADAGAPMQSLVDCVAAHAAETCEEIGAACETEAEAVGGAAEDVPAGAARDEDATGEPGSGDGASQAEGETAGGLFAHAFGGGDENGNGNGGGPDAGANGENGSGDSGSDSGGLGCSATSGRAPAALGLFLLALGGLRLSRRRR